MKDLPRGAAACQAPRGGGRGRGRGSRCGGRGGEGAGAAAAARPWVACGLHLGHAPAPADGRGPRRERLAKGSSRGLPNSAARGAPFSRSVPLQKPRGWLRPGQRTTCSQLRTLAVPPSGPEFPTGGRGEGRGFCTQLRPQGIPRRQSPAKNSLPPGRLPGLLPPPFRMDLEPRSPLSSSVSVRPPPPPRPAHKDKGEQCKLGDRASGYLCSGRPRFLVPLPQISTPGNTCPRDPHNLAGQRHQAVPAVDVDPQIRLSEVAGAPFRLLPSTPMRNQARSPPSYEDEGVQGGTSCPLIAPRTVFYPDAHSDAVSFLSGPDQGTLTKILPFRSLLAPTLGITALSVWKVHQASPHRLCKIPFSQHLPPLRGGGEQRFTTFLPRASLSPQAGLRLGRGQGCT